MHVGIQAVVDLRKLPWDWKIEYRPQQAVALGQPNSLDNLQNSRLHIGRR